MNLVNLPDKARIALNWDLLACRWRNQKEKTGKCDAYEAISEIKCPKQKRFVTELYNGRRFLLEDALKICDEKNKTQKV